MAFQPKSRSLCFLLLLLLFQLSDGFNGGSSLNRKLLVVNGSVSKEAVVNIHGKSGKDEEEGWELRAAPLGPDPLHHHGADPQKPRTP
ncbi:uncharacterized protein LOC143635379 [Bidens hawaiensis]|uniref:uncharacterized protein LOC143635379 n=1 Tax=Bidens hawaiensis TaxID=980011 RepID=UPI00404B491C